MGILSRAVWSYGRSWTRAINKHGKINSPKPSKEFQSLLKAKHEKDLEEIRQKKLQKKLQKKIDKENRILDKAREIMESRDPSSAGLAAENSIKKSKIFRA